MKKFFRYNRFLIPLIILLEIITCSKNQLSVKEVMDHIVTRLYAARPMQDLALLDDKAIMEFITAREKKVLATKYWCFDINVPAVVSVMRHLDQQVVPFWLPEAGFHKTEMMVTNEHYTYEVWQKTFAPGRVELGINGFDKHRPHYLVSVGAQNPGAQLELTNFFPEHQYVATLDTGAFTYHDWDELVLLQVPEAIRGHQLLTTVRGRAREAHLIQAFRTTPFPSSEQPDQLLLTWSDDPRTTQTIQWRTSTRINDGVVRYWQDTTHKKIDVVADKIVLEDRLLQNDRFIHRFTAILTGLTPGSTYHYIVGSPTRDVWSDTAEFRTAPNDTAAFTFVYFGDTHRSPHWGQLINTACTRQPQTAFYLIGGDVVSTGLYRDDWDQLFAYGASVINHRPLMPALGNHDDQDGLGAWMFYELFELPDNGPATIPPEAAYSFDYGNALFLVLAATMPVADQVEWLEQKLSSTKAIWKFAIFHFPPYSHEEDYPEIRQKWGALFDRYHVDMVMSGHVHYYMRSKPMYNQQPVAAPAAGTIYLISIAIPNEYHNIPLQDYAAVCFSGEMLYQTFAINRNRLVFRTYNIEGDIRDQFILEK